MGFLVAFFIIFAVFGGASLYIALRIYQGLHSFFPAVRLWPVLTVFLLLAAVMVLGFGRSMVPLPEGVKQVLGLISAYYMGIFVYLLLFTVAVDLVMILPRVFKLSFATAPTFKGFMTVAVLLLAGVTSLYGFWNARHIRHVSYEIPITGKADISDMKILLISDLHLGSVGSEKRLETIVAEINAQEPDLVCIAGDFFDTDFASIRDPERAAATLRKLRSTYGVYACLGNHDAGSTAEKMTDFLTQCDIRLLAEEHTVIDNRFVLVGRLDRTPIGGYGEAARKEHAQVFDKVDSSLPVIVLDHNPGNISSYHREADLILCGHTHKGQLFPASLITGAMYAVDYGYYRKDPESPHVVVTSGVGYWGMPMRVGTNCEIVTIRCIG